MYNFSKVTCKRVNDIIDCYQPIGRTYRNYMYMGRKDFARILYHIKFSGKRSGSYGQVHWRFLFTCRGQVAFSSQKWVLVHTAAIMLGNVDGNWEINLKINDGYWNVDFEILCKRFQPNVFVCLHPVQMDIATQIGDGLYAQ